jgi:hypothetical protein
MWFELKPLALFAVRTRSVYLAADGLGSGSELPIASFGPHMSKGAELRRARTALEVGRDVRVRFAHLPLGKAVHLILSPPYDSINRFNDLEH